MSRVPASPANELEELRLLLLRREQQQIRELRARLDDKEARARELASVLPQSVRMSREEGDDLARALQPAVEGTIKESVEKHPQFFVEVLSPILGPVIRRAIAESLRGLVQSLNQTLEHTFSWHGLKWRYEALRTGRPFAEVVLLRSLIYRVEQVFLVHRETSLPVLHAAVDPALAQDSGLVTGMLSAIQDFVRDSFEAHADDTLEEFRMGELQVWIVPGRHAYLAAVIRGNPSRDLRTLLQDTIDSVHIQKGSALARFDGDSTPFESLQPEIEACLRTMYEPRAAKAARPIRAWLAIGATAGLLVFGGVLAWRSEARWRDFVRQLQAEPGLAVTSAEHHWLRRSKITGLRDPLAIDPAAIATRTGVSAGRVDFNWKGYLALDAVSILRRFEQRFGKPDDGRIVLDRGRLELSGSMPYEWLERVRREAAQVPGVYGLVEKEVTVRYDPAQVLQRFRSAYPLPAGVTATVVDGTLNLTGQAPYEWIAPIRTDATKLPGVLAISEAGLKVAFDPKLVLDRFTNTFTLPDTVTAVLREGGVLTLAGEASHRWLTRVTEGAATIPGVTSLDAQQVVDLDQRTYQQSKSVIESAFVYFLLNKDNFATEGFAALSRLPDEIRRCETAAKRIGLTIQLEIRGSADGVGPEAKNLDLSQRRAAAVRDFLVSCGLDAGMLQTVGLGAGSGADRLAPEQADRRVAFRVLTQP